MAEGLSWVFEIQDKLSSPGRAMEASMSAVDKATAGAAASVASAEKAVAGTTAAMSAAGKAASETSSEVHRQQSEIQHLTEKHHELGNAHHSGAERLRHFFHELKEGMEFVFFAKETIGELAEKLVEFGEELIAGMAFKQNSLIALEAMTGTREAAREMFESVEGFAAKTGLSVESVMKQTKNLMSAGYDSEEIQVLRQLVGDLSVIDPGKADALTEVLGNMGRVGRMTSRDLMGLKHAGISVDEVIANLGDAFGGSRAQVKQWLEQGAIPAKDALLSIVKAEQSVYGRGGGGVGALLDKQSKTLPGAVARLKQLPELFMSSLAGFDSGAGGGVFAAALTNIADTFSPGSESGQRIIGRIRDLVDTIANMLGLGGGKDGFLAELAGPNGPKKIEEVFNSIADSVKRAIPDIVAVANALRATADAIVTIGKVMGPIAKVGSIINPLANPLRIGKYLFGSSDTGTAEGPAATGQAHAFDPRSPFAPGAASNGSGMSLYANTASAWTPPAAPSSKQGATKMTNTVFAPVLQFGDAESAKSHREAGAWRDGLADAWEQMQLQSGHAPAGGA